MPDHPDEYGPCGCLACRCRAVRADLAQFDNAGNEWEQSDAGAALTRSARALLAALGDRP